MVELYSTQAVRATESIREYFQLSTANVCVGPYPHPNEESEAVRLKWEAKKPVSQFIVVNKKDSDSVGPVRQSQGLPPQKASRTPLIVKPRVGQGAQGLTK